MKLGRLILLSIQDMRRRLWCGWFGHRPATGIAYEVERTTVVTACRRCKRRTPPLVRKGRYPMPRR